MVGNEVIPIKKTLKGIFDKVYNNNELEYSYLNNSLYNEKIDHDKNESNE